jgi:hypothetical protein
MEALSKWGVCMVKATQKEMSLILMQINSGTCKQQIAFSKSSGCSSLLREKTNELFDAYIIFLPIYPILNGQ